MKTIRRVRRSKGIGAILEGPHLIRAALAANLELDDLLATREFLAGADGRALAPILPRLPLEIHSGLLGDVLDIDSPRGIVAVTRLPRAGAEALPLRLGGLYVYVEGLQDPGNLGALARSCEAAGADGVCLGPGSAHPNHPRALRASAGSLLRFPLAASTPLDALSEHLAPLAPRWTALVPHGGRDIYREDLGGCVVLMVGAEGPGLSTETLDRADHRVTVPLASPVESLNATVAAAVALFEIRRQRPPESSTAG